VLFAADKPGTLLAMQMGTGKTRCALHLVDHEWQAWTVLVLCPKSVVPVWPAEMHKHLRTLSRDWLAWPPHGQAERIMRLPVARRTESLLAARASAYSARRPFLAVVNYEAAHQGRMAEALQRLRWQVLVLDECHRIKSPSGVASRFCSRLADRIPRRIGLTGTPMPHSPLDVYAQLRAIDKHVFGASNALFRARYARFGGYGGKEVIGFQNLEELHRKLYTVTFRVRSSDVLKLPELTEVTYTCELSPPARRAYQQLEAELRAELESGTLTAANGMVRLLRLAQITGGTVTNDAREVVHVDTAKADLLSEVLESLQPFEPGEAREPVVVFGHFHSELDAVHRASRELDISAAELSGRCNELAQWQAGDADLLVVQESAGGLGIDLTRARYAIYYSHGWSLGDYEQSRARVHRPGQTRPVTIIHLVAERTVDEVILRALARKGRIVDLVVDELRKGVVSSGRAACC